MVRYGVFKFVWKHPIVYGRRINGVDDRIEGDLKDGAHSFHALPVDYRSNL